MKTFIFTITKSTHRRMGGANQTTAIYRIKHNQPVHVADCRWCTAGYKGPEHEVLSALCAAGEIPKKLDGYYDRFADKFADYKILQIAGQ